MHCLAGPASRPPRIHCLTRTSAPCRRRIVLVGTVTGHGLASTSEEGRGSALGTAGSDGSGASGTSSLTLTTARNAAALTVSEVVGKAATFVYVAVAARQLGQADFGAFSYALAVGMLVQPLSEWGFDRVLVRRASADGRQLSALLGNVLAWKVGLGLLVFTGAWLVVSRSRDTRSATVVLALMLAAGLLDTWGNSYRSAAGALQRQGGVAVALSVQRLVTAALALVVLAIGAGVMALAGAYLAGAVVGVACTAGAAVRAGAPRVPGPVRLSAMREVFSGSFLIGASAAVAMLLFRVDLVIIEALLGDEDVAAYAVAYRLLETVLFLTWSLTRAVFPVMSSTTQPWRIRRGFEQSVAVTAVVYLPFAVVALLEAPAVIELVFGATYADQSAAPLRWLAPAPLLFALGFFAVYVLLAGNRDGRALASSGVATLANIALNLVMIPLLGIAGAALVTTATLALRAVMSLALAVPTMGWPRWNRMLLDAAVASLVLAVLVALMHLHVLLELAIGGSAYLATWYLVARRHSPEHLRVVRSVVARARP